MGDWGHFDCTAAGNAVLWKPSEVSTHSAPLLHSLLLKAGYPADLVQMLPATREMGPAVAEADVDHVVFTGSAATVLGTDWGVRDRCDGTLTVVRTGVVVVRDFGRRQNVIVHAGQTYLAKVP